MHWCICQAQDAPVGSIALLGSVSRIDQWDILMVTASMLAEVVKPVITHIDGVGGTVSRSEALSVNLASEHDSSI